jgi:RNA polymerase sigma-70 factor, ECF subfamily
LHLADRRIDPEQALIREQSIELVRTAVQALPPSLREYVEQLCLRDRSHKEVARALGISLEAGKSRSLRARLKLRCLLASRRGRTRVKLHLEEVRQPGERTV